MPGDRREDPHWTRYHAPGAASADEGVMKRIVVLAIVAASQVASASQIRSEVEIRQILVDRLQGFEQRVGIVVGVIGPHGRKIFAVGSMGMNDPRPVNGDTLFEAGSITKAFTSLLLADMVERGEVALDDPVAKYLPATVKVPARNGKPITLQDLSMHRSALPRMPSNFNPKNPANPYVDYPVQRLYEFLPGHELRRDIGAEYEYSNLGAGLLGHALARRAGLSYEGLLQQRVLRPLGMASSGIALTPALKARSAGAHTSVFLLAPTPLWEFTDAFAGAGSLRSSANDLLTFLEANLGYKKTPLAGAMTRMLAVRRSGRDKSDIGLAWNVDHRDGTEIVWHGGATYGSRAFMGFDPKARVGVVVLSNYSTGSGIDDIGFHLLDRNTKIDDGPVVKPRGRAPSTVPAASLDAYAGRYQFSDNQIWIVRRDGTRFFLKRPSELEFEIFPEGDFEKGNDDFFSKGEDALLTFDFDKDTPARATQLTFSWAFLDPRRAKPVE
jgi:CubicO group peptidase (beta-lactamase class C family)